MYTRVGFDDTAVLRMSVSVHAEREGDRLV